jgi:hypothetical protein
MSETTPTPDPLRPRRRLLWSAVIVALVAGLGALGLSIYNTIRFDDRVNDYVQSHRAVLAGARGPQGPAGPPGAEGPEGPEGPAGADAEPVNLSRYSSCLQLQLGQWMNGASVEMSVNSLTGRLSSTFDAPTLFLSCR